jgi:hypothetical protein
MSRNYSERNICYGAQLWDNVGSCNPKKIPSEYKYRCTKKQGQNPSDNDGCCNNNNDDIVEKYPDAIAYTLYSKDFLQLTENGNDTITDGQLLNTDDFHDYVLEFGSDKNHVITNSPYVSKEGDSIDGKTPWSTKDNAYKVLASGIYRFAMDISMFWDVVLNSDFSQSQCALLSFVIEKYSPGTKKVVPLKLKHYYGPMNTSWRKFGRVSGTFFSKKKGKKPVMNRDILENLCQL